VGLDEERGELDGRRPGMRAASENALSENNVPHGEDAFGQITAKIVNARGVAGGRRGQ
jgi:hypothetical protein